MPTKGRVGGVISSRLNADTAGGAQPATGRPQAGRRADYVRFLPMGLRWNDNDVFGHVNNAEYYAFFDTAVVRFLVESGEIGPRDGPLGMVVAESGCRFFGEIVFTDTVEIGLRVVHLGRSSVRYEIGVFVNADERAAAEGYFVHVFMDRAQKRPVAIPPGLRAHLESISTAKDERQG